MSFINDLTHYFVKSCLFINNISILLFASLCLFFSFLFAYIYTVDKYISFFLSIDYMFRTFFHYNSSKTMNLHRFTISDLKYNYLVHL